MVKMGGVWNGRNDWVDEDTAPIPPAWLLLLSIITLITLITLITRFGILCGTPKKNYAAKAPLPLRERVRLKNLLHFGPDFSFRDKVASAGLFWFALFLLVVNLIVTAWNFISPETWTRNWWSHYWIVFGLVLPFVVAVVTFVWFTIGGTRDIIDLFASLQTMRRDSADDGRVEISGKDLEDAQALEGVPTAANCDTPVEEATAMAAVSPAPAAITPASAGQR